ncbi:polysaccharide deacetylase family protein [Rhizobium sp. L1K21]|uniref:polysaccharide deacetylase family protein n=1 Tax=Rhizobium sp. L1K21 TaxID=2954933 RepID=UPI002092CAAE|nr:polysaccharide deacetylase family protein [Rhizobium sp. L1K21]MCO6186849.1 polysaccharide deacetylase family protein [Rhizobium sp. L1K21]
MNSKGLKYLAKDSAKWLAISAGLEFANMLRMLPYGQKSRHRGVIFTLHHVREGRVCGFSPNAHLSVTPDFLDTAIKTVLDEGYEIIPLHAIKARLQEPDGKSFAVFTLDDGYRNNASDALPVFTRYQAPFTVFAARGLTRRTNTIWWETVAALLNTQDAFEYDFGSGPETLHCRSLSEKTAVSERLARHIIGRHENSAIAALNIAAEKCGIDPLGIVDTLVMDEAELSDFARQPLVSIGAHTCSHRALAFLDDTTAATEMRESADYVEAVTGIRPCTLAYPYGFRTAVSGRDERLAGECGFKLAVTTQPGTLGTNALSRPYALPRISLNGLYQKARYVRALAGGLPFGMTG